MNRMLTQRLRHPRWRMSLILLAFLALLCNGESMSPVGNAAKPSSTTRDIDSDKSEKFASLKEISWQAWILTEMPNAHIGVDAPNFVRRITPKSVFIAPDVTACAEGYDADNMGRCVKSINIKPDAHLSFLLQRLNSLYGNNEQVPADERKSTGPLQVNIPLGHESESMKIEPLEASFSLNGGPVVVPIRVDDEDEKKHHRQTIVADQTGNDATVNEEEMILFHMNANVDDKTVRKPDAVIPIAEFVDETNDTSFTGIVDYKIPIDLKTLLNVSSAKKFNASDATALEKRTNLTEMLSPTLVLLISPTKLPNPMDDLPLGQNGTAVDRAFIAETSDVASNATAKEIVTTDVADSALSSTRQSTEEPSSILDEYQDNATKDKSTLDNFKSNESQEAIFYDDEEYSYSTNMPDEEDSMEGDEILKHGEAGMTIPTMDRLDHQRRNQTADKKTTLDRIVIYFNDSADKDEAGSNISSEVSIDGDLILETTLLDVNTEKVTTKPPDMTIVRSNENDSTESFAADPAFEPEVVRFSQDAHGTMQTAGSHKQIEQRVENDGNDAALKDVVSAEEALPYNFPLNPFAKIHTHDEKPNVEESAEPSKNPKDSQSDVPIDNDKRTKLDSRPDGLVRFSDFARRQSAYARYPSSEANSIHGPMSYKHHPANEAVSYGGTSTKSSVPVRQKPVYYMSAQANRSPQSDRVPTSTSVNNEKQKQMPDLLRFWSTMPLVRDPAIYPVEQIPNGNEKQSGGERPHRASASRRRHFSETRPRNVDRSQKRKMSFGD